jgi:predicted amidohydrolase YtcJ
MPRCRGVGVVLALALAFPSLALVQPTAPSVAIVNARVFTGVPAAPWAEALTVVGDHVGVVGTTASVRQLAGTSTRVIDAEGRVVIPGINDAHVHLGAMPPGVRLGGPPAVEQDPSLDEIRVRLKAAVAKAPTGGWIFGEFGGRVLDDREATRSALDVFTEPAAALPSIVSVLTLVGGRVVHERK